jgi:NAD(P)-dependent dehydrogenase (short-subunit alcohol dehydrogenase family)
MAQGVALITGAGRGIGRAAAVELAKRGYRLLLISRTTSELAATVALAGGADNALALTADVASPEDAQRAVDAAMARFGRLDALVNNAGYAPVLSMEQTTVEQWRRVMDVNLSGAFYFSRAAWPIFRAQGGGVIVNISTQSTRDPFPGFTAYAAAKAGLNLLGVSMAREGAPLGIRVHTLAPGAVETGMFRSIMSPQQVPTEQTLDPADLARLIAECVAGDLRYTSGEIIWVKR